MCVSYYLTLFMIYSQLWIRRTLDTSDSPQFPLYLRILFMMKQGWQRRKIEVELAKKRGQACITDFVN